MQDRDTDYSLFSLSLSLSFSFLSQFKNTCFTCNSANRRFFTLFLQVGIPWNHKEYRIITEIRIEPSLSVVRQSTLEAAVACMCVFVSVCACVCLPILLRSWWPKIMQTSSSLVETRARPPQPQLQSLCKVPERLQPRNIVASKKELATCGLSAEEAWEP